MQWNSIKKCVLDTVSDFVWVVMQRERNPWITQEVISKLDD
jgi:hypothetical protein